MKHIDFQVPDYGEFDAGPQFADGYARLVQAARPVGYWRLGDPDASFAADVSGHGHHGWYLADAILNEPGLPAASPDTAARHAGSNDTLAVPAFAEMTPDAAMTLTFWMRKEADLTGGRLVTFRNDAGDGFNVQLFEGTDGVDIVFRATVGGVAHADRTDTDRQILDQQIHHVTAVFDQGGIIIHVNGQPQPMLGGIGGQIAGNDRLVVGAGFVGVIDEVALFDRALDPATLAAMNDAGRITEESQ